MPYFSLEEFFGILADRNPVVGLLNIINSALSDNKSAQSHLSSLSNQLITNTGNAAIKIADDALVGGMIFMSENGPMIALACYATGNIEIGLVVDGITIASNVALDIREFSETRDKMRLASSLLVDGVSFAVPYSTGKAISGNIRFTSQDSETIINFVTEMQGIIINSTMDE
jgi:hypothetical protein